MAENVLSRPKLFGSMRESPLYRTLGVGLTDRLFLIGHADGLELNDPYQVVNMQAAINKMNADSNSPLLKGLLEAYNAGARDIWLIAAAPMSEYESDISRRNMTSNGDNKSFYDRYYDRLAITYSIIEEWDLPEIIVPLEASFFKVGASVQSIDGYGAGLYGLGEYGPEVFIGSKYGEFTYGLGTYETHTEDEGSGEESIYDEGDYDEGEYEGEGSGGSGEAPDPVEPEIVFTPGVDFVTQLVNHCSRSFEITGCVRIGLLGSRIVSRTNQDLEDMLEYIDSLNVSDTGKFVILVYGEGIYNLKQMPRSHTSSLAAHAAANLSKASLGMGLTYSRFTNVVNITDSDFTPAQLSILAEKKINAAIRTQRGKRGAPYECVLATDNTLGAEGTDYWTISVIRIISKCINTIRTYGRVSIGTINYTKFKEDVNGYLRSLVNAGIIKTYSCHFRRDPLEFGKVIVDVSITPVFGIRQIQFITEVGPGA